MKRISFMILPIAVISLLCGSCAEAPESVRSNNQKADTEKGQLVYVELPHILDGLDEALAKSYTKFKNVHEKEKHKIFVVKFQHERN